MAVFRKASCSRKGCTYWRVKLNSPDHGQTCPKCGSKVRQDPSYTIQWDQAGSKKTETLVTGNRREAERILRERESIAAATPSNVIAFPAQAPNVQPQPAVAVVEEHFSPPFSEVADAFAKNREGEIDAYARELISIRHLKGYFGDTPMQKITEEMINDYKKARKNQTVIHGKAETRKDGTPFIRKKNPRRVKKATIGRELSVLKLIFGYAIRKRFVSYPTPDQHPMKEVKISMSREVNHPVTREQLQTLFDKCHYNLAHLFEFIYETACRPGEAMSLRWVDIQQSEPTALLMNTKTSEAEDSTEELHLSQRALEIINLQPRICEFVFANPETRDRWKNINKAFRNAAIAAGLVFRDGPLRPHDLRHARLREAALAGINTPTLLAMSRHADARSLLRYTKKSDSKTVQGAFKVIKKKQEGDSAA